MHKPTRGELLILPSIMTIEIFDPDGKRYIFEQKVIETDSTIEITNRLGEKIILSFWQNRQPESNYPIGRDKE